MWRWIQAILGTLNVLNGMAMLFAGRTWYANVPGAADTGPYNLHFVQDIGAAFVVSGLALCAGAWRVHYWPAALTGAGFLTAHGLIHLVNILSGHTAHAAIDLIGIVIPAALALYSAIPSKGNRHA